MTKGRGNNLRSLHINLWTPCEWCESEGAGGRGERPFPAQKGKRETAQLTTALTNAISRPIEGELTYLTICASNLIIIYDDYEISTTEA